MRSPCTTRKPRSRPRPALVREVHLGGGREPQAGRRGKRRMECAERRETISPRQMVGCPRHLYNWPNGLGKGDFREGSRGIAQGLSRAGGRETEGRRVPGGPEA